MNNLKDNQLIRYDRLEPNEQHAPWVAFSVFAQSEDEEDITPIRKCPIATP